MAIQKTQPDCDINEWCIVRAFHYASFRKNETVNYS